MENGEWRMENGEWRMENEKHHYSNNSTLHPHTRVSNSTLIKAPNSKETPCKLPSYLLFNQSLRYLSKNRNKKRRTKEQKNKELTEH